METPVTKRFGRYEIVGELGRGAMGVVYKARDPQIDRLVALKTISLRGQEEEAETEFRLRFQNEAQAAGRLHHPGIVSVFDIGQDPETNDPFIVLEYVTGEALNKLLAREKKLPLARALQLTEEVATALDYAHAQGVTHRDVKPGNILITEDGHAKIADFGIAKLNLANLTIPGKVLGTPAYMAPEQLSGTASDGRSDLFSLGVILYAMVTGHSPFQGNSATTVCFKVANREPVPASALDLDLPRELDTIIARAMAKDPKRRYQRGLEFAEATAQLQAAIAPQASTRTGSRTETAARPKALSGSPAVGPAYAFKLIRAAILKAQIRDLILAAATVVMLVIVGAQMKLLVVKHKDAKSAGEEVSAILPQTPATPLAVTAPNAASTAKPALVKGGANRSAARPAKSNAGSHPAKEVVVPLSTVELAIRHQFKDATLTLFVDGKLSLSEQLHGGAQKHLVVFGGVRGMQTESLQIPAGKHALRIRVQTSDQTVDLSKTIPANLVGGADKTLAVSFDKHNTSIQLDWQ